MATGQLTGIIQRLRRGMLLRGAPGVTDSQLLSRYLLDRDEQALAALVRRHGPMVWGVCRRLLNNLQDAEDAFQATFLVLIRRATAIAAPDLLANWLYGVAHQTALKARAMAGKRKGREKQVTTMPEPRDRSQDAGVHAEWGELRAVLDEELSRLPEIYRVVIVLCDLEGKLRKDAARQLGLPEGTVASRLARARVLLAKRLQGRGITLSGGALAALLARDAAAAGVPESVLANTIRGCSVAAKGLVSVKVAVLVEGVLRAMRINKLKTAVAGTLLLGLMVCAAVLAGRGAAAQDDKPAAGETVKMPPKKDRDKAVIAWGKEAGGLQAGLELRPGERRVYRHGETITLVVRVRNVGNKAVTFEYLQQFLDEEQPAVTDADGKRISQPGPASLGFHVPVKVTLGRGQEMVLESRSGGASGRRYELRPADREGKRTTKDWPLFVGTGKFSLQQERVLGNSSAGAIHLDPALSKLATGKLELEIEPPDIDKKKGGGEEPLLKFEARNQPWAEVLEWLAGATGLPIVTSDLPPKGKFTYTGPQGKLYTIAEVVDILNEGLATHHLRLVRREASITILRMDEKETKKR